MKIRTRDA
jgi:cold shock protein